MVGVMAPHTAFLIARGLQTPGLRVARQNETASAVAGVLAAHLKVEAVFCPGV